LIEKLIFLLARCDYLAGRVGLILAPRPKHNRLDSLAPGVALLFLLLKPLGHLDSLSRISMSKKHLLRLVCYELLKENSKRK